MKIRISGGIKIWQVHMVAETTVQHSFQPLNFMLDRPSLYCSNRGVDQVKATAGKASPSNAVVMHILVWSFSSRALSASASPQAM
eukprot:8697950-Ditylum_brightwellii.AAC.1